MGRAVAWADRTFNDRTRLKGVLALALLLLGAIALGQVLAALPGRIAEVLVGAILLAQRSLVDHVQAVARALRISLPEGRHAVSMIVGRDTATLDEPAVARAAIESAAENFSDGLVAPAFWFAVAGLPGLLAYKLTNTADSMIGHRTPRHEQFGWAAARFDDLLNLIPARLSALLIWLTRPRGHWRDIVADARLHRSPNAGWPEASMARVLDVALSGPRSYHGQMRDFPWVHPQGRRTIGPREIEASVRTLWSAWAILLALAVLWAAI
ncbi:Adenosylcobinamide-phosphate synthase [Rubellimicrobium mesophilum DSM 19309]|uniref:Cobalamin biosynthesis protein CobD n=2 Tax=Rubellimicrobium TaxID=295418 RepID=A0A017HV99_9RHOB|nr:Adenosylcobinamide-phosphate synthase [Rubellimicrobium mesophilum DSM 19309]